jgi:TonB family protein
LNTVALDSGHMRRSFVLAVFFLAAPAGWADLTVRQQITVKMGPGLPANMLDMAKQRVGDAVPAETTLRVKRNRCASSGGAVATISDYDKGEVTLLNPKTKEFATVPLASYAARIANAMPQQQMPDGVQQMLQSLKLDVQTKKTGQTGSVGGIRAEEYLLVLSMAMPGLETGVKMEIHNWMAAPEELTRIPALKELAACSAHSTSTFDLNQALQKMFSQLPGLADKFQKPMEELRRTWGSQPLKTQAAMYIPALTALVGAQSTQGFDPNAPLMEVTSDLAGFSTDPIPDSAFEVAADFKAAPIEDLIKVMMPAAPMTPPSVPVAAPQAAAANPQEIPTSGALRIGNGVSSPKVLSRRDPGYTEEARRAKVQGSVSLSLVVDASGNPQNIRVVRSLDPGLDQKAIEAVREWKFQPGQKDGKAVAVITTIQVYFRLLDTPPAQQK